jgi:YidC/Oxa1 family membrane protein insertase
MIGVVWVQTVLNGLGQVLAFVYKLIPNYGVAIIILTVAIRVLLLPLGVKQIRSMQAQQALQPKIKALQAKYKGKPDGRQKIGEETMKLYREHGVNPASGCLPMLLQLPVLIALFAVLRMPSGITHVPKDSTLHAAIVSQDTRFVGANLLCSAAQAGQQVDQTKDRHGKPIKPAPKISTLDCGKGGAARVPYYVFALAMIGTTYYQQRQMQRATPGAINPQQQTLTRVMPLLFGVWGYLFPAGLVIYWTTTNLIQIGQQHFMLPKALGAGPPVQMAGGGRDGRSSAGPGKTGERRPPAGGPRTGTANRGGRNPAGNQKRPGGPAKPRGLGGADGGDRKKRRKR